MPSSSNAGWELLTAVQGELLLFAAVFFLLGALDELFIDCAYIWLRLTGRLRGSDASRVAVALDSGDSVTPKLSGPVAVLIPAWQEALVIGATVQHALAAWPQAEVVLYVGSYFNDPATAAAVRAVAGSDPRLRLIVHDVPGPTCKADCLNRLYAAMCADEAAGGEQFRCVVLHDAEDMVDAAALPLMDCAIARADFVQLPVLALPQRGSQWVAGHYSDEFAEAHGKTMVVRSALGTALPGAGVGCAVRREMLERLAAARQDGGPFNVGSLVEDYELGLNIARLGGRAEFLRVRTAEGRLVATRAFFPTTFRTAVRQKSRWTHGIALQGWDRLGWSGSLFDRYMLLRDRRGLLGAALLALAYVLVALVLTTSALPSVGGYKAPQLAGWLQVLVALNLGFLLWRAAWRSFFTAREYGWRQGLVAGPRILLSNAVAIVAGWRALTSYCRSLRGEEPRWDKTEHYLHPANDHAAVPEKLAA